MKFYESGRPNLRTEGQRPDNPPINSTKPYDEVSKSTNCPLIAKHSNWNYHIFALYRISFASVSNYFVFSPENFIFDHENPTAEMLLTVVLLRGKDFVEMEPLKGICHSKMYTVVGYTIKQIICDDNGAYGDTKSVKKDYYVQEEDGKMIVNIVYKDGTQYVQHVRNRQSYDKLLIEPSKVYTIERYKRMKSFSGLRHMAVKVKNVNKMYYEDFLCVVYSYNKSSADYEMFPHGN